MTTFPLRSISNSIKLPALTAFSALLFASSFAETTQDISGLVTIGKEREASAPSLLEFKPILPESVLDSKTLEKTNTIWSVDDPLGNEIRNIKVSASPKGILCWGGTPTKALAMLDVNTGKQIWKRVMPVNSSGLTEEIQCAFTNDEGMADSKC